jgi:glycosyltransferase involved in cell wall biosynthesis
MSDAITKRILFIGSGAPWDGGAGFLVRQNLLLGALGRVGELHLAMFDAKPKSAPAYVKTLTPLPSPPRRRMGRLQLLLGDLLSRSPRMYRGFDVADSRAAVGALHPESFDLVVAYRIDFAWFAGVLHHPRLILDIDDPEHLRWQRRLATTAHVIDSRTRADVAKLAAFESAAVNGAKLAFVCQENDRQGWPSGATIEVVPNCIEIVANPARHPARPIVLFVGNCAGSTISPNVDAILYFLADIWPKILNAVPEAEFHLVGATSDIVRQKMASAPRAQLRGFVDDLVNVYAESAISIAPLRFGTGTRIKILEAFAHGCPVVSTAAGAEGIVAIPGKEIELAVTADDFADRCIALLQDPNLADRIGRAGHALAAAKYDRRLEQDRLVARFTDFLNQQSTAGEKAAT